VFIRTDFCSNVLRMVCFSASATHMFTFATWEGIYCLYPEITLERRQFVPLTGRRDPRFFTWLNRGFGFVEAESVSQLGEWQKRRSTDDRYTLRIGFSRTREVPSGSESFSIEVDGYSVKFVAKH
jgi:hypothetical protein